MARNDAQIKLYVPHDLRDRIKTYAAQHGRSMNGEIVRILEHHFPAPEDATSRISQLLDLVAVLKGGVTDQNVDRLTHEVEEAIKGIVRGQITGIDPVALGRIDELWRYYQERLVDDHRYLDDLDEEEEQALASFGDRAKIVHLDEPFPDPDEDDDK